MHFTTELNVSSRARFIAARAALIAISIAASLRAQCVPAWSGLKHGNDWQTLALGVAQGLDPSQPNGTLMTGGGFLGMAGQWSPRLTFSGGREFSGPYGPFPSSPPVSTIVNALAPALPLGSGGVIAGGFNPINGSPIKTVARVDTTGFHPIGSNSPGAHAYALCWYAAPGTSGPELYLAGGLDLPPTGVSRWDGLTWTPLPPPDVWGNVFALQVFDDDGSGPRPAGLYVGGSFGHLTASPLRYLARWDGKNWAPVGNPVNDLESVSALAVYDDDGSGPRPACLYAGGSFHILGPPAIHHLARLDGQTWSAVGVALNSTVNAMAVFDADGDGPERESLFVGGLFTHAGQMPVNGIARWDGQQWHALGVPGAVGVTGFGGGTGVDAMTVFDEDGPGPNPGGLYVGGLFYYAGTEYSWHVARWGCPQAPERKPCFPDCDNDGELTLADFGCFRTNQVVKTPYADCNADGHWDLADFQCFQSQFALGCP